MKWLSLKKKRKLKNSNLDKTYLSGCCKLRRIGFYSKKDRVVRKALNN